MDTVIAILDSVTMSEFTPDDSLPQNFEQALAALEQIVTRMESGELALEQSLAAYQQGVQLAQICQKRLDEVEQQVQVLQGQFMRPLTDIDTDQD
ncbi:exodeoxyribonuclease VII small subunit [Paenalcaligenes hermetiae]|uniref:Exodeoxyribonuclease 7 small subunit n=2 Tax=Alcaligenaceae TaxID=506 RepID=A0ABP9M2D6_9BURK